MSCSYENDGWLESVLGYPAWRVTCSANDIDADSLKHAAAVLPQDGRCFSYVKISLTATPAIRLFLNEGFYPVDTSVTFARSSQRRDTDADSNPQITVRKLEGRDHDRVREIAATSIVYSRFHQDPDIEPGLADVVNRAWVDSYCRGVRGEEMLVAEIDGNVVGFNAIIGSKHDGQDVRLVDLIAVDKVARGKGAGQALMRKYVNDSEDRGLAMRITTQAANIPAVNLYERNGFKLAESSLVLHWHRH